MKEIEIVKIKPFQRDIKDLKVKSAEIEAFEEELKNNPKAWPVIPETGKCRKARMEFGGKGKSGGLRIVYIYVQINDIIYFLMAYKKGKKDTLTKEDKKMLKKLSDQFK